jgi:hypothetical protein
VDQAGDDNLPTSRNYDVHQSPVRIADLGPARTALGRRRLALIAVLLACGDAERILQPLPMN